MKFEIGREYSRTEIRTIVGDPGQRGKWEKGYLKHEKEYFIFSNTDGESYTGVNHNDYWINEVLLNWNAMKKSKSTNPLLVELFDPKSIVHIFTRSAKLNVKKGTPFVYQGTGKVKKISGENPVNAIWKLSDKARQFEVYYAEVDDTKYINEIEESLNQEFNNKQLPIESPKLFDPADYNLKNTNISIRRNKTFAINAIVNANFQCEIDSHHYSFISKRTGKQYVEAHHIIPLSKQKYFYNTLDLEANIVSLCPNCHKVIHYGSDREKKELLKKLYHLRSERLENVGLKLNSEAELFDYYSTN